METPKKTTNWIPTSFAEKSITNEGDSACSFQSIATPESNVVDLQSNDQSFDISLQKSPIINEQKGDVDKANSESSSVINIFEEDARSSWSEEPKQTEESVCLDSTKETLPDDENSRNSVSNQKSNEKPCTDEAVRDENSRISISSQKSTKNPCTDEAVFDETSRNSVSSEKSITKPCADEAMFDETSRNSVGSEKSITKPCADEAMFDETSRNSVSSEKSITKPCADEAVFDENSRNSEKSVTKPRTDEAVLDESSRNSVSSQKSTKELVAESAFDENSRNSVSSQKSTKECTAEATFDENSQNSVSSQKSTKKCAVEAAFDENSRNSVSSQKITKKRTVEAAFDENSRNSVSSQKSTKKPCSEEAVLNDENKREFPPENLCEYMWPQEKGEFYILQEQICDYLNVKSFKRKYPDLVRRSLDPAERKFLKEKGVVTEMQCDLGLTALKSEEVLELLSKDYPDHYKEYIKVLREKEQKSISDKHKEYVATNSDKNKMVDLVKKAVQSAAEYNMHLNQERRDERKSCMDLQTYTIHYPVKTSKVKKTNTKPGKYPVALLPGQFQDYYKEYSPTELKYLPVNTVLYGPLKELNSIKATSDGSQSDSDDSTASDGSCSSSQGTHDDSSSSSEKTENNKKTATPGSPYQPKTKPNAACKVCKVGIDGKTKDGKSEELVHCSDCENSAHPSCIELTAEVVAIIKTYPWQCMDCKVCSHCRDPNEEDKMLFCDICDRGYHTFCVGLKSLPQGKWICRQCGTCSICGVNKPGPETSKTQAQWQYDITKGNETDLKNRHPKLLCQSCFKKKR